MKFLKHLPIETYILVLPSIVFLSVVFSIYTYCELGAHFCLSNMSNGNLLLYLFNYKYVFISLLIVSIIVLFTVGFFLNKINDLKNKAQMYKLRSIIFITLSLYVLLLAIVFAVQIIFYSADYYSASSASTILMNLDMNIFGSYLPIRLNQIITSTFLSNLILKSYMYLNYVFCIILLGTMLRNIYLLRKLIFSIFIACLIGIPFWFFVPAVAPDSMYRLNIFNNDIPVIISNEIDNTNFLPNTKDTFLELENFWIDKSGGSLGTSTFPSMHSAWGVIITIVAIELWAPLVIIMLPWLILELIGTMYTLQHYAVDTVFGIIIGIISYIIASRFLKYEKRYFVDKYHLFD